MTSFRLDNKLEYYKELFKELKSKNLNDSIDKEIIISQGSAILTLIEDLGENGKELKIEIEIFLREIKKDTETPTQYDSFFERKFNETLDGNTEEPFFHPIFEKPDF